MIIIIIITIIINNYWMSRDRGYPPKPKAEADNPYRDLDHDEPQAVKFLSRNLIS